MKNLYTILYKVYVKELHKLNIGYTLDENLLQYMFDLVNAIDYIENGQPLLTAINKIIAYYE